MLCSKKLRCACLNCKEQFLIHKKKMEQQREGGGEVMEQQRGGEETCAAQVEALKRGAMHAVAWGGPGQAEESRQ